MGQALYRKYRSKNFAQVVGQDHITQTLEHAIKAGKISHAYLFTGPRGVGKTSVARILAHEVNSLPYNEDSIHLDIIEIDAASNRRIDEIRDLRDKVHITPASAKYKVYIIDEVHMLTREAFNALLKTLEEPPAHCIFILATTEVHKLPDTIISRTQRFNFKQVDKKSAITHLKNIAKKEKIEVLDEALELLAEHGQGSFRDSISLLDQLSTSGQKITADTVRELVGLPPAPAVQALLKSIDQGDSKQLLQNLEDLFDQGVNPAAVAKELSKLLRHELVNGSTQPWLAMLLRQLLEVPASPTPADSLEISLLEAAAQNFNGVNKAKIDLPLSEVSEKIIESKVVTKNQKIEPNESVIESKDINFDLNAWPQVVEYSKKHAASIYTALRLARPVFSNNTLTLYFEFPLHQKKIDQSTNKDLIGQIIEEVCGVKIKIDCALNKELFKNNPKTQPAPAVNTPKSEPSGDSLKSISNIFGKAEMIESN